MSAVAAATIGLGAIKVLSSVLKTAAASDSLVEYTKPMRVEPIVLVDSDCMFHDGLPDLMQTLQSIFCGYYLQAVAISTTVGRVNVMGQLGKLNPNRDPISEAGNSSGYGEIGSGIDMVGQGIGMLSRDGYAYGLPSFKKAGVKPGLEDMRVANEATTGTANVTPDVDVTHANVNVGRDVGRDIAEAANLSVGKMLSVEISDGNARATIPIAVRLLVNSIASNSLIHILSPAVADTTWSARWHAWKAGRLETVKDMIFCQDLIDAHREKLMDETSGNLINILNRKRKNQLATIASGTPSVATCSNMLVMSDTTMAKLELESGLQFKSPKDRQKLFDESSLMIIAVVDKRWDRVTLYTRSIPEHTTVSFRDIKVSNRGNGADISEILKAYQLGNSPSI